MARPLTPQGRPRRSSGPGLDIEPRRTLIAVPEGVAHQLASETRRDSIPTRTQMGDAVPYGGELYEQADTNRPMIVPAGATVVLAGLRRAWPLVGFAVYPGDGLGTLTAQLRVNVRGLNGCLVAGTALGIPAGGPLASVAFFVAARAELIVTNTGAQASQVKGVIYGMITAWNPRDL